MENLRDLFEDQLKDIYDAERQLTEALPKLAKAADSDKLAQAFKQHLEETQHQIERLDQIASELEVELTGKTCEAAKGLIAEGQEMIEEHESGPTRDAGLIAASQRFEHYEISAYGTARDFAKELGLNSVAKLLQEILDEESRTNELLTKIAHAGVNSSAAKVKTNGASRSGSNGQSKGGSSNLEEMTKQELYEMAQEKDIPGRSEMSKKELVKALS